MDGLISGGGGGAWNRGGLKSGILWYSVICLNTETDNFITVKFPNSPQNGQKLDLPKSVENILDIFLSSVWYLIKQLFHSRLLDMSLK